MIGERMSREKINLFGDDPDNANNALYQAILDCADDEAESNGELDKITEENYHMYKFLDTPRTSLVCFLVDKLRENGFDIVRKE
jgi:hypothetical protein